MIILIILFGIGLTGMAVMLSLQISKLQTGDIDHSKITEPKISINVANVRKTIWQMLRALVHLIIMKLIRFWAYISHKISKKWNEKFGKKNNIPLDLNGNPVAKKESFFLHSISEYKMKLMKHYFS